MDILKMLAELRDERQRIDEAIIIVERLAATSRTKRRGRPPKWMAAVNTEEKVARRLRRTHVVSAAGRKRMAESQKRRWAERKAQANQKTPQNPT